MNTKQNPTGVAALAATVLIWAASVAGVAIPQEVAAAIVGLVAAAVSYLTPRNV